MSDTTLSFRTSRTSERFGRDGRRTTSSRKIDTPALRPAPEPDGRSGRLGRRATALLLAIRQSSATEPQMLAGPTGGPLWTGTR